MENTNYSIAEEFRLPSNGEVYSPVIDPQIRLKSMTTLHEKKLQSMANSDAPLKVLSEIIDDCTVDKKDLSSYDMVYGDFEYLLHKLRVVTFGPEYPLTSRCPVCGLYHTETINLDEIPIFEFNAGTVQEQLSVKLPKSKKVALLKLVTPRMRDEVAIRAKQILKKTQKSDGDPAIALNLEIMIDTVDNEKLNPVQLTRFVADLPMMDGKVLSSAERKITIGLDTSLPGKCPFCTSDYNYDFPFSREFFDPTLD